MDVHQCRDDGITTMHKTKKIITGLHHDKNNLIATINNDVKFNEYNKMVFTAMIYLK